MSDADVAEFESLIRLLLETRGDWEFGDGVFPYWKKPPRQRTLHLPEFLMRIQSNSKCSLNVTASIDPYGLISILSIVDNEVCQANSRAISLLLPKLRLMTVLDRLSNA